MTHFTSKRALSLSATLLSIVLSTCLFFSCTLDPVNPNAVTEDKALTTRDGIFNTAVGLQRFFAVDLMSAIIRTPGTTSRELAITRTFINLTDLEAGGQGLSNENTDILVLFQNLCRAIEISNQLIAATPSVTAIPDSTRNGILAIAHLHKAMALSYFIQYFEQAPINTDRRERAVYAPRAQVLAEALRSLDQAEQLFARGNTAQLRANVLSSGLDMVNTIRAFSARCHLMAGNYQAAIDAANSVNLTARSQFVYDAVSPQNIMWLNILTVGAGANTAATSYACRDSLGLPPQFFEVADSTRRNFFLGSVLRTPAVGAAAPQFHHRNHLGFGALNNSPIPIYRPIEMILIRAEANVRLGRLADAVADINRVRQKTGLNIAFNIGANPNPYTGPQTERALLDEIYKQRCIELYLSGLRMEDARRLGIPGPQPGQPIPSTTRTRNFYPYPRRERDNNPNTPPDPVI
ncbi:MAG: RagB/SusD family nutrient uptake outer membrane protein [Chloroherpetonaceae bacterium]|nr:RagB/SusD family nutrient uptake outer membrane protein [Chloroherpetonaceae bacterium]